VTKQSRPDGSYQRTHPRVVGVRLPDKTYIEIQKQAAREGVSISEINRQRLERGSTTEVAA
jgi:hypothetical protein